MTKTLQSVQGRQVTVSVQLQVSLRASANTANTSGAKLSPYTSETTEKCRKPLKKKPRTFPYITDVQKLYTETITWSWENQFL